MRIKEIYEESKKKMEQARDALIKRYARMRGGRARADLVSEIKVDCYGSKVPLKQLSNISVPEPRLIVIEPWDKSLIKNIEKAILTSELGINPSNDGNVIRLAIPSLTEERREKIAKVAKQWGEEVRISIRNIRREAREKIESLEKKKEISEDEKKKAQKDIQTLTDDFIKEIDEIQERKVNEIRQI
ncbi:ribosome recycling factor [Candidatus Aerophobetes bacterium]|uniref:Ribosome-recycling factor n=1 Tax=Aerophobetes bacterium TaxID=2030807 RepID=A0A662D5J5_UNCAE|nr:MAG: ribosome recycling factor [Candidatus Aerophobetes bacterium]